MPKITDNPAINIHWPSDYTGPTNGTIAIHAPVNLGKPRNT